MLQLLVAIKSSMEELFDLLLYCSLKSTNIEDLMQAVFAVNNYPSITKYILTQYPKILGWKKDYNNKCSKPFFMRYESLCHVVLNYLGDLTKKQGSLIGELKGLNEKLIPDLAAIVGEHLVGDHVIIKWLVIYLHDCMENKQSLKLNDMLKEQDKRKFEPESQDVRFFDNASPVNQLASNDLTGDEQDSPPLPKTQKC